MRRSWFLLFTLLIVIQLAHAQEATKSKAELEAELKLLEEQVNYHKQVIQEKQKAGASLSRDVQVLESKIKKAQTEIKIRSNNIQKISNKIAEKDLTLKELTAKDKRERQYLAQALRNSHYVRNENDIVELISTNSFSSFYDTIERYGDLQSSLNTSLDTIKKNQEKIANIKAGLEEDKEEEMAAKTETSLIKREIEENQSEKKELLNITKGEEAKYKAIVKNTEAQIAKIKSALFSLSGVKAINFGSAYDYAKKAEEATGVRAAVILGIITVESNLGQNVGKGNWNDDMHPTRDKPIFKQICEELGLDPDTQPVSKRAWYGYGGAMGPAQFIPSTWVSYKERVSAITGNRPANPWNVYDAFIAAALYLKDNGADKQTRDAEHRAAMCYLAGCGNAKKASLQFYGNDTLRYADKYQAQIDILQSAN